MAGRIFRRRTNTASAGFGQVLRQIAKLWETRRGQVLDTAGDFHQKLEGFTARQAERFVPVARVADQRRRALQTGI